MSYDPQRSHRRPRLADDAPAPIDALLGDAPEPAEDAPPTDQPDVAPGAAREPVTPEASTADEAGTPEPAGVTHASGLTDDQTVELPVPSERRRTLLTGAVAVLLVLVLLVAWLRRRRG